MSALAISFTSIPRSSGGSSAWASAFTGSSRSPIKAGWEYLFVAIDDHARIGFTDMYPDETKASAVQFLQNTVAYFRILGRATSAHPHRQRLVIPLQGVRCKPAATLKLKHSFTRPYRPQTNGKAERFIQSALREWAYGIPYNHSSERTAMLERWMHHYNWHRPHQGINGAAPISRLASVPKQPLDASQLASGWSLPAAACADTTGRSPARPAGPTTSR